jgi:transposase
MPPKANDQVITDRHDAMSLARLMRSRDLTPVDVPAVDAEAIRAMRRARDDTLRALQAAQRRRKAFLRWHALRSPG